MQRIAVSEAKLDFANLVNRVYAEGIGIEIVLGDKVIAQLIPATPRSPLKVQDLNAFLQRLPKLGDDSEAFSDDVRAIRRSFPAEANRWIDG